jgi:hypothetical protein
MMILEGSMQACVLHAVPVTSLRQSLHCFHPTKFGVHLPEVIHVELFTAWDVDGQAAGTGAASTTFMGTGPQPPMAVNGRDFVLTRSREVQVLAFCLQLKAYVRRG